VVPGIEITFPSGWQTTERTAAELRLESGRLGSGVIRIWSDMIPVKSTGAGHGTTRLTSVGTRPEQIVRWLTHNPDFQVISKPARSDWVTPSPGICRQVLEDVESLLIEHSARDFSLGDSVSLRRLPRGRGPSVRRPPIAARRTSARRSTLSTLGVTRARKTALPVPGTGSGSSRTGAAGRCSDLWGLESRT
jgi:hypothetical protein